MIHQKNDHTILCYFENLRERLTHKRRGDRKITIKLNKFKKEKGLGRNKN